MVPFLKLLIINYQFLLTKDCPKQMFNMRFVSQDWVVSCALILLVSCTTYSSASLGKPENNIKTSVFKSPKIELGPGLVSNKFYFDVDFPRGHIALKSFNAELVDESGKSLPLQETYLHHWFIIKYQQPKNVTHNNPTDNIVYVRNSGFCQDGPLIQYFGLGSETRGTATDIPDPFGIEVGNPSDIPYGYDEKWLINVHPIDTRGVEDRLGCIECRCDLYNITKDADGNPLSPDYKGGLDCCPDNTTCRLNKGFKGPKRTLYLKYTVKWFSWDNYVVPLKIYILDVTDVLSVSKGVTPMHNCEVSELSLIILTPHVLVLKRVHLFIFTSFFIYNDHIEI